MNHWSSKLPKNACRDAVEWCRSQPTAQAAWDACENPQWMLWLIFRVAGEFGSASRCKAASVIAKCIKPELKFVPPGEKRPAYAIALVEKYGRGGDVTQAELRDACAAAYAASAAAADAAMCKTIRMMMPKPPRLK